MSEDTYQQRWLEEKFITLNDKIDVIDEGVKKMNGKVADHEKAINDIKIAGVQHILDCPVVGKLKIVRDDHDKRIKLLENSNIEHDKDDYDKRIKVLEDNSLEYNFFKKYPKAGIALLFFALAAMFAAVYSGTRKVISSSVTNKILNEIEQIDN